MQELITQEFLLFNNDLISFLFRHTKHSLDSHDERRKVEESREQAEPRRPKTPSRTVLCNHVSTLEKG